jgi:hypothetical protein
VPVDLGQAGAEQAERESVRRAGRDPVQQMPERVASQIAGEQVVQEEAAVDQLAH